MAKDENRSKALAAALGQIEKQFGKGSIMKMGEQERVAMPCVSTGSLGLDVALGIGGLPYGRICEIYGPDFSGEDPTPLNPPSRASHAWESTQAPYHGRALQGVCRSVGGSHRGRAPCSTAIRARSASKGGATLCST